MNENSEKVTDCLNSPSTQKVLNEKAKALKDDLRGVLTLSNGLPKAAAAKHINCSDSAFADYAEKHLLDKTVCITLKRLLLEVRFEDITAELKESSSKSEFIRWTKNTEDISSKTLAAFTGAYHGLNYFQKGDRSVQPRSDILIQRLCLSEPDL